METENYLYEYFPLVNIDGEVTGKATRSECHGGAKLLHPVVHLHLFNGVGELYLQKRPHYKDIEPDKWDTSVGGHVDYGESIEEALRREAYEELGVSDFIFHKLAAYIFESNIEKEYVHSFITVYDGNVRPDPHELADGRFWKLTEISKMLGNYFFTPNFENEFNTIILPHYEYIKKILSAAAHSR
ncbi:MAG: NUDIX domain-containing protein [Tannerella sp.]|jgi:isopentenyldiphosphate isomerase|nr:NUDIX domain-containing protein [Tannerella sp.]